MTQKIVAVVGSTGTQGGSVVDALLQSPNASCYSKIRCLTRNTNSEKAKKLASKSDKIELVQADISNKDSLTKAFANAWAVFAVTNYWDPGTGSNEYKYGTYIVDAAKQADVKVFIWSSLENSEEISNGKLKVPHFTLKAKVDEYLKKSGLSYVIVQPAFYYTNVQMFFPPKPDPQSPNKLVFTVPLDPNTKVAMFDPVDTGPVVAAILEKPENYFGKCIPMVGEVSTVPNLAIAICKANGKEAVYNHISYEKANQGGNETLNEMLLYFEKYGYFQSSANLTLCKQIYPGMKDIQKWIAVSKPKF